MNLFTLLLNVKYDEASLLVALLCKKVGVGVYFLLLKALLVYSL